MTREKYQNYKKDEELKKLGTEVSEDTLISVKILALKKKVSMAEYLRDVIEKHVASKSKATENIQETY